MRSVLDTDLNPECVLSATAHSTECTSTNMMEASPSPNQISASGRSAMAGSGWKTVSGFCTTPMSPPAMTSRIYSGRVGGTGAGRRVTGARSSAMGHSLLFLDAIRKQDLVDAVRQFGAGAVHRIAAVAVELALDLTGVRRHPQGVIADQHGLEERERHVPTG